MNTPAKRWNLAAWPWAKIIVAVLVLVGVAFLYHRIDVDDVHDYAEGLNSWLVFVLITVLPLVGFPVTVLHVVAGMRWGPKVAIPLVFLSIFLQLLASYALVRLFRPLFEKRLAKLRERIPRGAHGPVTLFTALLPGVPYFAKNYVLPLIGVPLRTYVLWCFPLHAARSSIAVLFGHESDQLTPGRIAGFAVYFVLISLSCAWVFRRMRAEVGDPTPAASGQRRSA